jgi:hypothetical protein
MAGHDATGIPDGRDLVATMEWEPMPYGCVGIARRAEAAGRSVWSWLILIPWAVNDTKPWIDGTELVDKPLMPEADQHEFVLSRMREILDERYGETVGGQTIDRFLRELEGD